MCGLCGFLATKKFDGINELTESLLMEAAVRGTDSTGIAYNIGRSLNVYKRPVSAYKFDVKMPKGVKAVIGHTRHATQGDCKNNYNNHPFCGKCGTTRFAFAHNGILTNDTELKKELPKTKIETDSYVAVQLLEKEKELNMKSIKNMAEKVRGSFSFSILDDKNNLYLVKGDSPLSILYFKKYGMYVYASTSEILWKGIVDSKLFDELKSGSYEEVPIDEGEILKIDSASNISRGVFTYTENYWGADWRNYLYTDGYTFESYDDMYFNDLVSAAGMLGYSQSDIEELLQYGMSYDEIEEYLYCREEV